MTKFRHFFILGKNKIQRISIMLAVTWILGSKILTKKLWREYLDLNNNSILNP